MGQPGRFAGRQASRLIGSAVKLSKRRRHIDELVEHHEISVVAVRRMDDAYAMREADGGNDEIAIAPVRSAGSYPTALHEIGHILGRYQQSAVTMVRERWAWQWARDHAVAWTPTMERVAKSSLAACAMKISLAARRIMNAYGPECIALRVHR